MRARLDRHVDYPLLRSIRKACGREIEEAVEGDPRRCAVLAALTANGSGGSAGARRFSPALYENLRQKLQGVRLPAVLASRRELERYLKAWARLRTRWLATAGKSVRVHVDPRLSLCAVEDSTRGTERRFVSFLPCESINRGLLRQVSPRSRRRPRAARSSLGRGAGSGRNKDLDVRRPTEDAGRSLSQDS